MGEFLKRSKFAIVCIFLQIIFIILIGTLGEYGDTAKPEYDGTDLGTGIVTGYPLFQDVHVMIFIGFGFLMTFLKRYGYSAIGLNLLISAFAIQWAYIIRGLLNNDTAGGEKFPVFIGEMLSADFAAATVLISFGAVLGKTSPLQLIIMALLEVTVAQVNEYIGLHKLSAQDVGESMYIHAFGAYFGLAVARVLYTDDIEKSKKEGPVYHSDLFSMIGTIFLWMYWPSFNGGAASGDEQHRAIVNTYISLVACTVVTFAVSSLVDKRGKFSMVHIQNSTLAGGVAVGTTANMPLEPWGAMLMGSIIAVISVLGFQYLTPLMSSKLKIHDTCGVNNLHGMPGVFAGLAGVVMAGISSYDKWGKSVYEIFPAMVPVADSAEYRNLTMDYSFEPGEGYSAGKQAGFQMAALIITLVLSIVGGIVTGFVLKIPFFDTPDGNMLFDDHDSWNVEEGYPYVEGEELHNGKDLNMGDVKAGDGAGQGV